MNSPNHTLQSTAQPLRGFASPCGGEDPFDALMRALRPFTERADLDDYPLGRDFGP